MGEVEWMKLLLCWLLSYPKIVFQLYCIIFLDDDGTTLITNNHKHSTEIEWNGIFHQRNERYNSQTFVIWTTHKYYTTAKKNMEWNVCRTSIWSRNCIYEIEILNYASKSLPSRAGMVVRGWGIACGNCPKTAG